MRRHRRSLEFRCPPLIIIGISLAPGCSSKSEANKFILLAEGLEFFPRILVYLNVDIHPYMESRPKQVRAQTRRFGLTHPRRGKNPNGGSTLVRARSPFLLWYSPGGVLLATKNNGHGASPRRKGCLYATAGHPIPTAYRTHRTCRLDFWPIKPKNRNPDPGT